MLTRTFNTFSNSNLKEIEKLVWDFFQQGVKNKKSSFHYPAIASISKKSLNLRTVILRKVLREDRMLFFYTDYRSNKVQEIKTNNLVLLHVYDKKNNIQIQAKGKAKIIHKAKLNQIIWNSMSEHSKLAYMFDKSPGKKITNENDIGYLNQEEGFKNFTIIKMKVNKITFLKLNCQGNKKALFEYSNKTFNYFWLVP
ncbi:MAG: hypothetical protein CFH34_01686 [Alphaproteobacteria bacterium MarineAlpha9_Bin4]|nr:hypothetical protein [Pelagibacterales bacterium]PPR24811.1 MAG: hypothetical protein CFH34_01686 [Alphaproteobacteria bacterium MarineAlpha9_Bin4]|tara:strand:+ start:1129 stop:1719 length:591 start_codon:yes stop_codon:yes gene_type:complete